jgi:hypothetical protein
MGDMGTKIRLDRVFPVFEHGGIKLPAYIGSVMNIIKSYLTRAVLYCIGEETLTFGSSGTSLISSCD